MKNLARLFTAERAVISVILLNTVALIAMGYSDPKLAGASQQVGATALLVNKIAVWIDYGCVVYFIVEVVMKVRQHDFRSYWANSWNRFDFIVVLLSAPVLLSPFIEVPDMSTFLALRLGRLFRLFRVMRFIPNRDHLYDGIKRALKASIGVFLALLIVNLVLSLGATQLFGQVAPEYFGDPALSSYSLFKVFTVEGWYEIPDAIAARSHPALAFLARVYFVGSVLVGGILGFSLANAVFVDEMTTDNIDEVERKIDALSEQVKELKEMLARHTTGTGD